jgi:hypothetical protein
MPVKVAVLIPYVLDDGIPELAAFSLPCAVHQPRKVDMSRSSPRSPVHAFDDEIRGFVHPRCRSIISPDSTTEPGLTLS